MKTRLLIALGLLTHLTLAQAPAPSVLATGDWYKLAVSRQGIYKLDRAFLRNLGVDVDALDPRSLRIYGQGGGMLPQPNALPRPTDLLENAIWVRGEDDGRLDADDYILFFAQGPDAVVADPAARLLRQETNLYDDQNYYFLTTGPGRGKRLARQAEAAGGGPVITAFDDFAHYEREQYNLVRSGRQWFGERFDLQADFTFRFPAAGLVAGGPVQVTSAVMAQANAQTAFVVQLNGRELGRQELAALPISTYARKGLLATNTFAGQPEAGATELAVRLSYQKGNATSAFGHLDYLSLNFRRNLLLANNWVQFRAFRSLEAPTASYQVGGAGPDVQVWDVTDPQNATAQAHRLNGQVAEFHALTRAPGGRPREYVALRGSDFEPPKPLGRVPNQNLRQLAVPELLIITHPDFGAEARRLANYRQQHSGLASAVVTTTQVYHEFASGRQDVTALRDFVRHLYRQSPRLRYVLLLGDASYDYKDRLAGNSNWVPTYESRESLHPIFSFSSDDYFGFLDDQEGEWDENGADNYDLEVGIGRLPVSTAREAGVMVDKLIRYDQPSALGSWRNRVSFVADNGDFNIHLVDSDRLADKVDTVGPQFNTRKIFTGAFPLVATPNGRRSPATRDAINRQVEEGTLIMNYTGHGGETGWSSENILDIGQVNSWQNLDRLPLFVTATCEFGRFDNPEQRSGAEYAVLSPRGGGIAMLTTTRPVFSSTNFILNQAFYGAVFAPIQGQMPRLGDVQRLTKNRSISGVVNRNFALLGDPSLRLAYPAGEVVLTAAQTQGSGPDTLQALGRATLRGEVRAQGRPDASFNGVVDIEVFDKRATQRTRPDGEDDPTDFAQFSRTLFRGSATVRQGRFEVAFAIPKDLVYAYGYGRVALYARDTVRQVDAAGFKNDLVVGGTAPNFVPDDQPPAIRLWLDNEQFADGGTVRPDTRLLARLRDDSGLTISNLGLGRDLTATLDGRETWVLNDLYQADRDDARQGRLQFDLRNLAEGPHTLQLKAWDTHNNSAEASLRFVVERAPFAVDGLAVFPNPFAPGQGPLTFRFSPNKLGEDLRISLRIYSPLGQLVRELETIDHNVQAEVERLTWDGLTDAGTPLANGVYYYRLSVQPLREASEPVTLGGRVLLVR
jgi:hypothetical protein